MIKFKLGHDLRNITDENLLNDIIRVAKLLRKNSITNYEYREYGKYGLTTIRRRFGKWSNAIKKAGLKKTRNYNITDEELFKNIEEIWIKLGRQPRSREFEKPLSKYNWGTYSYRFGTWRKALEAFIQYINNTEVPESHGSNNKNEIKKNHKTTRHISSRLRFIVMKRDNFKCKSCGRSPATDPKIILHVDHIIPWTTGGETISDNLQTLCSKCNIGKSNIII